MSGRLFSEDEAKKQMSFVGGRWLLAAGWGCGTRFCLDARNYHHGSGPEGVRVNGRRRQKCQKQKRRLRDDESGTKEMDANLEARRGGK